jgi:hypothetical protein
MMVRVLPVLVLAAGAFVVLAGVALGGPAPRSAVPPDVVEATIAKLIATHGESQAERAKRGVTQVAERWWPEDGDPSAFVAFCESSFLTDPAALAALESRLERVLEQVDGHLHEVRRELLTPLDLDTGTVSPVDRLLADLDPSVHTNEDLFKTKVAFLALLNFPVHPLSERLAQGGGWTRDAWARSRMMDRFADRIPARVLQGITTSQTAADAYIADYNIRMDRLVSRDGKRPFPTGLRLITHWGLRDELASHYGEADALVKQRMIQRVMERIVRQEIPAAVIDNPDLDWCPETNEVRPAPGATVPARANLSAREPDRRYALWLANFQAARAADPYTPTAPTAIARVFDQQREIPEEEVEALLVSVLTSSELSDLAALVRTRLGRPLEPFDIWYSGFKPRAAYPEEKLDTIVRARYPTVAAFQADLPRILAGLGFSAERAKWLSDRIVVDPSRGSGHAMGAVRREDVAHLRTRIPSGGMNYKGFNIAVHELGHNVEQTFSLHGIDQWFLNGVPNTAFTEAFAMLFQERDMELLGLATPNASAAPEALGTLWVTAEIAAVSLVDMKAWHWLYQHPDANPAQLRQAVLAAAREVWNRYYAPLFGQNNVEILAIYSHMITNQLYLPDYALGHIIAFQLAEKVRGPQFGAEFERMARQGRLTPGAWMEGAVGRPISAGALLAAARSALAAPGS